MSDLILIRAIVPRLRKNRWENEEIDYGYSSGMLYIETPPEARVGTFPSIEEALEFLKTKMYATIVEIIK